MSENRHTGPSPGHAPHDRYGAHHAHADFTGGYAAYGAPGYGYGVPAPAGGHGPEHPPGPHVPPPSTSGAISALVVSIMLVMTCCGALAVVGVVHSALALSERNTPEKYRRHTRVAWISNGVILTLLLAALVLLVVLGLSAEA